MAEYLAEYEALLGKVDATVDAIAERRAADLTCGRGCSGCCHVELELLPVEAAAVAREVRGLSDARRATLAARADAPAPAGEDSSRSGRCVMLDDDGGCAIYRARPVVCRTQGHALRYPEGVIPPAALLAHAEGDVTWCQLNYERSAPGPADVLDTTLLSQLLFVVNGRFTPVRGPGVEGLPEKTARTAIRAIAADPECA